MTHFSANLGFLWSHLPLPEAIRAAGRAGFHAVECHWPYDTPVSDVVVALSETGLPMLGLNTRRGDVAAGELGLCAVPGREAEAREAIDEALNYAAAISALHVHVMAGCAEGQDGHRTFLSNLRYATAAAQEAGVTILIEPLNLYDAPGYFLKTTDQARTIIEQVDAENLKLMFDCYHVGRTEGDPTSRLKDLLPIVGHIQFASVPDRRAPDHGEVDYRDVFKAIGALGWEHPLGAEYIAGERPEDTLGWLKALS